MCANIAVKIGLLSTLLLSFACSGANKGGGGGAVQPKVQVGRDGPLISAFEAIAPTITLTSPIKVEYDFLKNGEFDLVFSSAERSSSEKWTKRVRIAQGTTQLLQEETMSASSEEENLAKAWIAASRFLWIRGGVPLPATVTVTAEKTGYNVTYTPLPAKPDAWTKVQMDIDFKNIKIEPGW